ncbi:nucleotidyltransferase domain-containing protein [Nocardia bhagyanarayanae]|uniref:nucleotidyltransferase domain-containing protein n=1 Tax=Nocardia bhagyanarayanae TaxID=1215925 RepID=UPI001C89941A|nr:hypothetical protein [Nocardia bhagyanarayanae]
MSRALSSQKTLSHGNTRSNGEKGPEVIGRPLSAEEAAGLWAAWTPAEVAERMAGVSAPWYVAAGWALDLFTGGDAREHSDLEIGIPRERFDEVAAAFPGFEWDVVPGHPWLERISAT